MNRAKGIAVGHGHYMDYSGEEVLSRVEEMKGKIVVNKCLIVGVQTKADLFNSFDDKFYFFEGRKLLVVTTGTTNAGKNALLNFKAAGLSGTAVWKTNEFYEDLYSYGLHKGKMPCLRQVAPIKYYRDSDGDEKAEEQGKLHEGIIYANFHGVDYNFESDKIREDIGGWSYGCQVCNNMIDYRYIIRYVQKHPLKCNYALLKEW